MLILKKSTLITFLCTPLLIFTNDISTHQTSAIETTTENHLTLDECKQAHNEPLKLCFKKLSHKERIELFEEISFEQKDEFLEQLNLVEYDIFLDDFNEYDWQRICKKLPKNVKRHWTRKIPKQRLTINKTYLQLLQKYGHLIKKDKPQKTEEKDDKK